MCVDCPHYIHSTAYTRTFQSWRTELWLFIAPACLTPPQAFSVTYLKASSKKKSLPSGGVFQPTSMVFCQRNKSCASITSVSQYYFYKWHTFHTFVCLRWWDKTFCSDRGCAGPTVQHRGGDSSRGRPCRFRESGNLRAGLRGGVAVWGAVFVFKMY